jgi:SAM-dependent methyltransferase
VIVREHFVPDLGLELEAYIERGDTTAVQHLIRYLWAVEMLAERHAWTSLLDLGCGAGYGCYAIARRFPAARVVGIDSDSGAIARARRDYVLPNLDFRVGDAMRWEALGGDEFDCIVSFDSIEHFEHRELVLERIVEHLALSGCLLLSTPCGNPEEILRPDWSGHRIEYSARGLYDFLRRYFRTIRRPEDGSLPQLERFERLEGTGIPYLLQLNPVVCEHPVRVPNPYRGTADVGDAAFPAGEAELLDALARLTDEVGTLRAQLPVPGDGAETAARLELLLHHLNDSLEELEADNAALRADNDRLLASQRQILAVLGSAGETAQTLPAVSSLSRPAAPPTELVHENARLRERLKAAESEVSGLRQLERTRAWKLLHLYWAWARRLRDGTIRKRGT